MLQILAALSLTITMTAGALAQSERQSAPSDTALEPELSSRYYRIANCATYQLPDEPVWETGCAALDNWSIFLWSTEHGSSIAYAHDGSERSEFTRPPMMRLYGGFNDTVEFRITQAGPFATIHRYVSEGPAANADTPGNPETGRHDLLMVTALRPGSAPVACVIAYVDALMIAEANEAARLIADNQAPTALCDGSEPELFSDMQVIRTRLGLPETDLSDPTEAP